MMGGENYKHVGVLIGLKIGYEGYGGTKRWMNEVGSKKWVWKTRKRKGGGMTRVVRAIGEKHEHGREERWKVVMWEYGYAE